MMPTLLNRLKGGNNNTLSAKSLNVGKTSNAVPQTRLDKLVADAGPIREDGSDKFFGMENFGSTCYCNSIIQCLYHSPVFREHMLNFPNRTPTHLVKPAIEAASEKSNNTLSNNNNSNNYQNNNNNNTNNNNGLGNNNNINSPTKLKSPINANSSTFSKEEFKDSSEFKKKTALLNGPVLNLDYTNSDKYGMTESLFTSLKDLFEAMVIYESRTGVVSPQKFLDILRRDFDIFRTPMHQDAHEFLNLLLNQIVENVEQYSKQIEQQKSSSNSENSATETNSESESSSPPLVGLEQEIIAEKNHEKHEKHPKNQLSPNSRWLNDLFEGTLTSETRCMTCEHSSFRDEAFLDISVDLDVYSSVTSCLGRFSDEEMLCERNKFHCDRCGGLQEAEKRMKLKNLPRILALHLKRFKYTEDLQRLQKLFHHVSYPYYLRLFNTTVNDGTSKSTSTETESQKKIYELYAIVVHIGGGPYHGHYVSIVKTQNNGWLLFDDENVEPVEPSFVYEFFGGEQSLACAYVLFYHESQDSNVFEEEDLNKNVDLNEILRGQMNNTSNDHITLDTSNNDINDSNNNGSNNVPNSTSSTLLVRDNSEPDNTFERNNQTGLQRSNMKSPMVGSNTSSRGEKSNKKKFDNDMNNSISTSMSFPGNLESINASDSTESRDSKFSLGGSFQRLKSTGKSLRSKSKSGFFNTGSKLSTTNTFTSSSSSSRFSSSLNTSKQSDILSSPTSNSFPVHIKDISLDKNSNSTMHNRTNTPNVSNFKYLQNNSQIQSNEHAQGTVKEVVNQENVKEDIKEKKKDKKSIWGLNRERRKIDSYDDALF